MYPFAQKSVDTVGTFIHNSWDNTCQAVHDFSHQTDCSIGKDGFHVTLDVSHFQPSEVSVKIVDNTIIVEAKHEERDDGHGPIERHLVRKYNLPRDYDVSTVHSDLSSNGILTIKAPRPKIVTSDEHYVLVTQTNAPAPLKVN